MFSWSVSESNRNKNKNKRMGPNQIYKLLHSIGIHKQNEKTNYRMGGNICKWCDQQGLNFQNIQTTQSKNGERRPKQMSPKKTHRWPTAKDRCSTGLIIREMNIKTTMSWSPHSGQRWYHITSFWSEWQSPKSLQIINAGESVEKMEPSCTAGGNANWCSHDAEHDGGSLTNQK